MYFFISFKFVSQYPTVHLLKFQKKTIFLKTTSVTKKVVFD